MVAKSTHGSEVRAWNERRIELQAKNRRNPYLCVDLRSIGDMFRCGRTPPSVAPLSRAGQTLRPSFIQSLRGRSHSIVGEDPRSSRNPFVGTRAVFRVWRAAPRSVGVVCSCPPRVGIASDRSVRCGGWSRLSIGSAPIGRPDWKPHAGGPCGRPIWKARPEVRREARMLRVPKGAKLPGFPELRSNCKEFASRRE